VAKITLSSVGNILTAGTAINNNSALLEEAIENTLSRDGTEPNEMNAVLDMNDNRIINLPVPVSAADAARKADVDALLTDANAAVEAAEAARDAAQGYATNSSNSASASQASAVLSEGHADDAEASAIAAAASAAEAATFDPDLFYTKVAADARYQPVDATLTALAGVSTAADQLVYADGVDDFAVTPFTAFSRTLLDDADAATARTTLGAGDVVGPGSAVDNAAARYDSTTGKLIQGSVLVIADTTGDLSRSGGGGIDVQGTNTNDAAAAGEKGELISSTLASGSAISLTTQVAANITSISLTAGDWDVSSVFYMRPAATTTVVGQISSISTTSATADFTEGRFNHMRWASFAPGNNTMTNVLPPVRLSLASTTTVYLVGYADFGTSTMTAFGTIRARRIR
jgi:hypothetical protein